MKRWRRICLLIVLMVVALATGCSPKPDGPVELVVSAAASMSDALSEAKASYEAQEPVAIRFNFGSSGALAQQIEQGAPVDLFISAATGPMDGLVKSGLVAGGSVQPLASNRVVLVRSKATSGQVAGWEDLRGAKRVALGNPQHVPAGQYGRAVLEGLNLWTAVEPKLILAEDVRQVLHFVETGEVDAGIVYRSDAAASAKVVVVAEAPMGSHSPVHYPMAVVSGAKRSTEAQRFMAFLRSPQGQKILARHGFDPAE